MFDEIKDAIALYIEFECSSPEISQKLRQLTVEELFEFAISVSNDEEIKKVL